MSEQLRARSSCRDAVVSLAIALAGAGTLAAPARAQERATSDTAGIRQAALDYIEGWYEADPARMSRAIHPELAKRIVVRDPTNGAAMVRAMGASELVMQTRRGGGQKIPTAQRRRDVAILDIYRDMATVKLTSAELVDYLHLARVEGQWRIVNVLWDMRADR